MDPELISCPWNTCLGQGQQGPLEELKQTRESPVHRGVPLLRQRQSERLTHTRSRCKAGSPKQFPVPLAIISVLCSLCISHSSPSMNFHFQYRDAVRLNWAGSSRSPGRLPRRSDPIPSL